jgi:hypothetical protein
MLARVNNPRLLQTFVNYGCKKFYNIGPRRFLTYFSMMRHVAFHHRPARTARLMKIFE